MSSSDIAFESMGRYLNGYGPVIMRTLGLEYHKTGFDLIEAIFAYFSWVCSIETVACSGSSDLSHTNAREPTRRRM